MIYYYIKLLKTVSIALKLGWLMVVETAVLLENDITSLKCCLFSVFELRKLDQAQFTHTAWVAYFRLHPIYGSAVKQVVNFVQVVN